MSCDHNSYFWTEVDAVNPPALIELMEPINQRMELIYPSDGRTHLEATKANSEERKSCGRFMFINGDCVADRDIDLHFEGHHLGLLPLSADEIAFWTLPPEPTSEFYVSALPPKLRARYAAFYPDQPDGRPAAAMAAEWLMTQAPEQEERLAWVAERRAIEARRKPHID